LCCIPGCKSVAAHIYQIFTGTRALIDDMFYLVRRENLMIKALSVITLVLIPLLWGIMMVPVLDFFEYIILKIIRKSNGSV